MLKILVGDVIEQLRGLHDESVQCVVTSPPYWGLRDYGTAEWEGGDDGCDHQVPIVETPMERNEAGDAFRNSSRYRDHKSDAYYERNCGKCGARRIDSQLGLEASPELYVQRMVEVFRAVRRVLRKDGTLWLNLGDSYNANQGAGFNAHEYTRPHLSGEGVGQKRIDERNRNTAMQRPSWLKPKDLVGNPWMLSFALRADGWWLRSDIIWAKPNPMPESVTDRPTKSHEYLFLLTKSANYFYDAEAIKEKAQYGFSEGALFHRLGNGDRDPERGGGAVVPGDGGNRNKRSVWTVATAPYPEAHFATYPPDLVKPCILAGSRVGDTILDPFAGSGTTGMVALELGRKAVLIELNPKYVELIKHRCNVTPGLALA